MEFSLGRNNMSEWGNDCKGDIYFLVHCLYNAKTELYDRTLTDMRSRYDPTEAFITRDVKSYSDWYSMKLYEKCRKYIEAKTYLRFDEWFWRRCVHQGFNLSAQGWIDLYEQLIKDGYIDKEMLDFCEVTKYR